MKTIWNTTRPLGALTLIIGILTYLAGSPSALLFIAGLILLLTPSAYGREQIHYLQESASRAKVIVQTALFDALFWMVVFVGGYGFFALIRRQAAVFQTLPLGNQAMLAPEIMGSNAEAMGSFIVFFIVGSIILLALAWFAYSVSRLYIWTTILGKQKTLGKFIALNAAWWALWLPLFIIITYASGQQPQLRIFAIGWLVVVGYFSPIIHTLYFRKNRIGYSLSHGIAYGLANIPKLAPPYAIIFMTYVILYQGFRLLQTVPQIVTPVSVLFVILFFAWMRVFLTPTLMSFEE